MTLSYELFKKEVTEKLKDFLPEIYQDYKIEVASATNINTTTDKLTLKPTNYDKNSLSLLPSINMVTLYEGYKSDEDLTNALSATAKTLVEAIENVPNITPTIDFENAKDNIVMMLINTKQNEKMLETIPNRPFQDLSIIYRWIISTDDDGVSSSRINNDLAKKLDMNEEQLYIAARENTIRLFPPTIRPMNEIIKNMLMGEGMPEEMAATIIDDGPKEKTMYVLSNERSINGAITMLYEENLQQLAQELNNNLYLLPSSIHEVIAVSTDAGTPEELADMVSCINADQVELSEQLSNLIYFYDKELKLISLATTTTNSPLIYNAK